MPLDAPVLVFPAGMADACRFADRAAAEGDRVIGASSLTFDPAQALYGEWAHLPYFNAPDFAPRLAELVRRHGIGRIHTPHPVIHKHLQAVLPDLLPGCRLEGGAPFAADIATYRAALRDAPALADAGNTLWTVPRGKALGIEAASGLLRQVRSVPGMCDDTKLAALAAVARHVPDGDLVEIGSWWGKSATALAWLARFHGLGALLCVDPWSVDAARQGLEAVDAVTEAADHEEAARLFRVSLLGLGGGGGVNYLRMPSVEGAERFRHGPEIRSEAFGTTRYTGQIALLHIDGNHRFDQVSADLAAWMPMLADRGWLVLDDYLWPFGDGPRRAGDALLQARLMDVVQAFTSGSALFVQFRAGTGPGGTGSGRAGSGRAGSGGAG